MSHKIHAARLEGKAHGLKGHAYHGKHYDDMDEARAYHDGYKEGIDECYGMNDVATPAATVPGMASQSLEEFSEPAVGSDVHFDSFAFESLDKQLSALLESEEVSEGISVSVSKGNQGAADSVNVNATDGDSDRLLAAIKQAGLGLFGGDDVPGAGGSVPQVGGASEVNSPGGIDVVGDHDGMLNIMKKLSGIEGGQGSADYAPEKGPGEETVSVDATAEVPAGDAEGDSELAAIKQFAGNGAKCPSCGAEASDGHSHGSEEGSSEEPKTDSSGSEDSGEEKVDEVETEDQMEFNVAEENAPDSGAADTEADDASEAGEDAALAGADSGQEKELAEAKKAKKGKKDFFKKKNEKDEDDKDKLEEWANNAGQKGTDATFEQDIEFMQKVIAGGLNKPKSTGQTTVPVIAGQKDRMGVGEEVDLPAVWAKLAGIRK